MSGHFYDYLPSPFTQSAIQKNIHRVGGSDDDGGSSGAAAVRRRVEFFFCARIERAFSLEFVRNFNVKLL